MKRIDVTELEQAASDISGQWKKAKPELCVLLPSAFEDVLDQMEIVKTMAYKKISVIHFGELSNEKFKFAWVKIKNKDVFLFLGRRHYYEEECWAPIIMPVYVSKYCGAKKLLMIDIAGGITKEPTSIMLLKDHVNLMGTNPLVGEHVLGSRFPVMSNAYCNEMNTRIKSVFSEQKEKLEEGVLAALLGPAFETESEIKIIKGWGIDALSMGTVPETIFAKSLRMDVAAMAGIVNYAAGISTPFELKDINSNLALLNEKFKKLLPSIVEKMLS